MDILLNKTKTLTPAARLGIALQYGATWQLVDSLSFESMGDGWQWMAICHEVSQAEADAANAPRTGEQILAEQAPLLPLLDGLSEEDKAAAQAEIDITNAAIGQEDLAAAEWHEARAQALVRENLQYLVGE
jgi:hypothetical protein